MKERRKIQQLPPGLAGQIAAGEVVERPLSIVKELVENAIDAEASSLVVEIQNGGKSYIRITDDGLGITEEEAPLVFDRYATSKIDKEEDLGRIETLGFRGEAVASIAAVSRVELLSKTRGQGAGFRALVAGGQVERIEPVGTEEGTTFIVTDLFYNMPARKKFLRSDGAEAGRIIDFVSKMAIAYPSIRFRLINKGTILFSTRGNGDVAHCLATVYSRQLAQGLLPLESHFDGGSMALKGWIGRPDQSKASSRYLVTFVNGRWVKDALMDKTLKEAYRPALPQGRWPAAFLFLEVPPSLVDVNIHPNKTEVRFLDAPAVEGFLSRAFRAALLTEQATPPLDLGAGRAFRRPLPPDEAGSREEAEQVDVIPLRATKVTSPYAHLSASREVQVEELTLEAAEERFRFAELTVLGQLFATYIVAKSSEGLYLIDQHAAHERVLFEQILHTRAKREADSQLLLSPLIIESARQADHEEMAPVQYLQELGYDIEAFGPKEYILKAIPAFLEEDAARRFAQTVLEEGQQKGGPSALDLDKVAMQACKEAVKGNDRLDHDEILALFDSLDRADQPFSCPHGRPTFLRLSQGDLEKMFQRR